MSGRRYDSAMSVGNSLLNGMYENKHGAFVLATDYDALLTETRWAMETIREWFSGDSEFEPEVKRALQWLLDNPK